MSRALLQNAAAYFIIKRGKNLLQNAADVLLQNAGITK